MKCEQTRELLSRFLLGDLDEAETAAVRAHLETCEGCRAERRDIEPTLDRRAGHVRKEDDVVELPELGVDRWLMLEDIKTGAGDLARAQHSGQCRFVDHLAARRVHHDRFRAEEFEPTAQTIRNWVKRADIDDGLRDDGLTTAEREELRQLRRENKRLREEREILSKAAAWFAQRETGSKRKKRSSS